MKPDKLVIFDWDGTVMNTVPKIVNTVKVVADQHQLARPSDKAIRDIIGLSLEVAIDQLFERTDLTDELAVSYKHAYINVDNTQAELFPHVRETLSTLKQQGFTLAVATGKSRVGLNRLMLETDLAGFFSSTRTACECASKPNPEMLLEICDELNFLPSNAVMIGDTSMDLEMAQNAQMASIGVSFGAHTVSQLTPFKPLAIVDQFEQLLDLI